MQPRYRTFFWPAVLILAGIVALLVNTGAIPLDRLILLVNLWPVILIVVGLEVIARRGLHGAMAELAAAVIVLLAVGGAVGYLAVNPSPLATQKEDVKASLGELKEASLEVAAGSATINVSGSSDLGSDLYQAHIEYPGTKPDIRLDRSNGALLIAQHTNYPFGIQTGRFTLTIALNAAIPWAIIENTGASHDTINIPEIKVSRIQLNVGAAEEDISLGPVTGTVPVEINGGALTVHIHRDSGAEASVSVSGGAVSLDADGHVSHGVGDLSYQSSGWTGYSSGYHITVSGGACTVTLDRIGSD
ncbi:MAG TPA: DUF5668 domain-containing protein [Candidatus Dormibacteraeota bacterium]|nr:DUF5668 domain-containing protein [Candidatus Dormibacteraeota bacterium]